MAEPKKVKARVIHKHATAAVWDTKTSFIPLQGELIVYDKDSTYNYERFKVGDGATTVVNLPFAHVGSAEVADKLSSAHNIVLNGDVNGSVSFDGSKDVIINTELQGTFTGTFEGDVVEHSHNFKGTAGTVSASYTPAGTVSATYTPKGSISTPDITVNKTKKTLTVVTNAGTQATYTQGSCTFPQLGGEVEGEALSLRVSGGKYTPGVYAPGTAASTTSITYLEDATATSSKPTFSGDEETINSTFAGTPATITTTFTPEGTIEETGVTPTGDVTIKYNN